MYTTKITAHTSVNTIWTIQFMLLLHYYNDDDDDGGGDVDQIWRQSAVKITCTSDITHYNLIKSIFNCYLMLSFLFRWVFVGWFVDWLVFGGHEVCVRERVYYVWKADEISMKTSQLIWRMKFQLCVYYYYCRTFIMKKIELRFPSKTKTFALDLVFRIKLLALKRFSFSRHDDV